MIILLSNKLISIFLLCYAIFNYGTTKTYREENKRKRKKEDASGVNMLDLNYVGGYYV